MAKYEILVKMGLNEDGEIEWAPAAILLYSGGRAGFLPNTVGNSRAWEQLKLLCGEEIGSRIIKRFGDLVKSGEEHPMSKLRWDFVSEPFIFIETSDEEDL